MDENQEQEGTQLPEQSSKSGSSVAQKTTNKVKDKIMQRIKKSAKSGAAKHSVLAALGPILFWVFVIIVILIVIIGIAMFLVTMPGMVMDQLKEIFKDVSNSIASWFGEDSTTQVDYDVLYETIDYLNEMGYDIKGYGFLTSFIESESDLTKDQKKDIGEDKLSEVVYEDGVAKIDDKVVAANSDYILTYLISDNYTYTIKNKNLVTQTKAGAFLQHVVDLFGHFSENKTSGLISIYKEGSKGLGDRGGFYSDTGLFNFEDVYIKDKTLTIKKSGILNRNNYMSYSLDGWTGRYGMPIDFLLSVHVATLMPDLSYDMVKSFGTQINLILHQVDSADVESSFLTDSGTYVTYGDFDDIVGFSIGAKGCSKKDAMTIMKKFGIKSQTEGTYACTGSSDATYVVYPTDYDGYTASDAHEKLDNWNDFVINRDKLEDDYNDKNYSDWASLYQYIYDSGEKNDDGTYTFVDPASWYENAAFKLSTLKQMIIDCNTYWNYCNEMTGDNQANPFDYSGTYEFAGMKGFDNYEELSIPNLIDASKDSEYSIDLGTWTKTNNISDETGETDDVDYILEMVISTKQGDDNWVYSLVVYRDLTEDEMKEKGISLEGDDVCSNSANEKACKRCRKYIRAIYKILKKVDDNDFDYYIPYIENVTDHWYRDVYFTETAYNSNNKSTGGTNSFVVTDAEYEAIYNERWTLYETYDDTGEFKYYALDKSGKYATSTSSIANYDANMFEKDGNYYRLKSSYSYSDATNANITVSKKAETITTSNKDELEDVGWSKSSSSGIWTAYDDTDTISTDWEASYPDSQDLIKSKIYYKFNSTMTITQTGEGQRTETNSKIKKMFLSNNYFRYDGSEETAEIITALRNNNNIAYGPLSSTDLEKTTKITKDGETKEYKVKDYAGTVSLEQDSLNAFSMLENTHTLDADYIYRDFKELIVELGYFTKEELTDETPKLLQWIIPDISSYGYPNRAIDKDEDEYGTAVHSKGDIDANMKDTMQAIIDAAPATTESPEGAGSETEEQASLIKQREQFDIIGQVASLTTTPIATLKNVAGIPNVADATMSFTSTGSTDTATKTGDLVFNGVSYETWKQTHSTCTLYAFSFIAQAYTGESPEAYLKTSTGSFINYDKEGQGGNSYWIEGAGVSWSMFDTAGISGSYYFPTDSDVVEKVGTALSEGKPVFFYGDLKATAGYHAVVLLGASDGGKVAYFNPGPGSVETYGTSSDFATNLNSLFSSHFKHRIFIPDEAPSGVKSSGSASQYAGYQGNEAVVSPVTGILLEYGTYSNEVDSITGEEYRVNADLKDEDVVHDKVGYAKILVLDAESYQKLESNTSNSWKNDSLVSIKQNAVNATGETSSDKVTFTEILTGDRSKDKSKTPNKSIKDDDDYNKIFEDWTNLDKTVYGYKEFAERYEKAGIAGYIIYIDGFVCETPDEDFSGDVETDIPDGEDLTLDSFKKITESDLTGTDAVDSEDLMESKYEKDDTYKLSSQKATDKLNAESEIKDEANSTIYANNLVFIKEGTVLGRTMTDKELIENIREEKDKTYDYYRQSAGSVAGDADADTEDDTTSDNADKVMGNYIRIIMRDLDDTVVENVEDYMKLDEGASGVSIVGGNTFVIPESVLAAQEGRQITYEAINRSELGMSQWSQGTNQRAIYELWKEDKKATNGTTTGDIESGAAVVTIDGKDYILVALKSGFGNVGDYVQITFENGEVIDAIIGDAKGSDDGSFMATGDHGEMDYGHSVSGSDCNVLEVMIKGKASGNTYVPGDTSGLKWWGKKVTQIVNAGSIYP
jgi:hypothetical protein